MHEWYHSNFLAYKKRSLQKSRSTTFQLYLFNSLLLLYNWLSKILNATDAHNWLTDWHNGWICVVRSYKLVTCVKLSVQVYRGAWFPFLLFWYTQILYIEREKTRATVVFQRSFEVLFVYSSVHWAHHVSNIHCCCMLTTFNWNTFKFMPIGWYKHERRINSQRSVLWWL